MDRLRDASAAAGGADAGSDASGAGLEASAASGGAPPKSEAGVFEGPADASTDRADAADGGPVRLPRHLSETGLYADIATETLAVDVEPFVPRFVLWTDGATKRRWLRLPAGTSIDATDPDGWVFPVGTKVWKEFTRDGVRVETRFFWKVGEGTIPWRFAAYVWDPALGDAVIAPNGAPNVRGTPHDVPSQFACYTCHSGSPDLLLGVSAVGLSHDTTGFSQEQRDALGLTLERLNVEGRLEPAASSTDIALPGTSLDQAALGVLHANCGHCHRPGSLVWERIQLDLHLAPVALETVETTGAFRTAVGISNERVIEGAPDRIVPGRPEASAVYVRMSTRDPVLGMPTLGTEDVDVVGQATIFDWIAAMPPLDAGTVDARDAGGDARVPP